MIENMKSVSFVIPVYNEAKRLRKTFAALEPLSLPRGFALDEIIFVNDGSTDTTLTQLRTWKMTQRKQNITLITYQANMGKGYAIRQGMTKSTADYTLFFDADISTPLSEI